MKYFPAKYLVLIFCFSAPCMAGEAAFAYGGERLGGYAFISPEDAGKKLAAAVYDTDALLKQAKRILKMQPVPLETVHVEGVLDFKDAAHLKDWSKTLSLALAYRLSNDSRYLAKAHEYLGAWLDAYYLSLHIIPADPACTAYPLPNPGKQCVDPIDDTELSQFVLAYDILKADLSAEITGKMARFMRNMALSYLDDIDMRSARLEALPALRSSHYLHTNWHSHRIKLAMLSAFETADTHLIDRAVTAFKKQIAGNLVYPGNPAVYDAYVNNIALSKEQKSALENDLSFINNGSVYDFYQRNALHYVVYDIEPLLQAALIADINGFQENLYRYTAENGAQLARAVKWLQPFAEGDVEHAEFVNSSVSFDVQRAKAGLKNYAGNWEPIDAKGLFKLAVVLDRSLLSEKIRRLLDTPYAGEVYDPWFNHKFAGRELLNRVWSALSAK